MKKVTSKIVSNSIFLMISSLSATAFSFLYWLIIGKLLLPGDYGIISTTINFSIFLSTISVFGLSFALIKLIPEYLSKRQNYKVDPLIGFSLKFMVFSSILIGILLFLFSKIVVNLLNIPHTAVLMASLIIVLITLATYFDSVLRGFQNMRRVAIIQILGQISKLILSFVLIILGFGYLGPIFGFLALYTIIAIIGLKFVRIKVNSSGVNSREILTKYSFPAFLSTILSYVFYSGRFLILNVIKTSSVTGIFSLATILTSPLILLPNVLLQAIFPVSSELVSRKNYKITLNKTISYFLRYTLLIILPMAVFISIFSKQLILLFSRPEYLSSAELFPILATSSIILSLGGVFYQTLYVLSQTKLYRNIMIISIIIFLITSVPLTYMFSGLGMSFSVLIFSLSYSLLSYVYLRKFIKISIPISGLSKIIFSTFVSMTILYFLTSITYGLEWNIISSLTSVAVYMIMLVSLNFLEKIDINLLKNLVMRIPFLRKYLNPIINLLYKLV